MGGIEPDGSPRSLPEWADRVEVDVADQRLRLIRRGRVVRSYPCSTAAHGTGCANGSHRTPTGLHEISAMIGYGMPTGAVFEGRAWTGRVWSPTEDPPAAGDLILTRILWLAGLEPGHNRGGDRDTRARHIYIHGTNHEHRLGQPASAGCVRLANTDMLDLFERVRVGDRVLITDGHERA